MNGSAMGNVEIRLDLTNGMRIAALANVADDSRTMLMDGLAYGVRKHRVLAQDAAHPQRDGPHRPALE